MFVVHKALLDAQLSVERGGLGQRPAGPRHVDNTVRCAGTRPFSYYSKIVPSVMASTTGTARRESLPNTMSMVAISTSGRGLLTFMP